MRPRWPFYSHARGGRHRRTDGAVRRPARAQCPGMGRSPEVAPGASWEVGLGLQATRCCVYGKVTVRKSDRPAWSTRWPAGLFAVFSAPEKTVPRFYLGRQSQSSQNTTRGHRQPERGEIYAGGLPRSARTRTRASSGTEGSTHVRPAVRWPFMLSITVAGLHRYAATVCARKGRLRRPYRGQGFLGERGVVSLELSPRQPVPA